MELLSLLRTLGALGVVLGLLAGALWVVRRFDIKLPGRIAGGPLRRLELIERLPIDGKRAVALIRRDGREHLILLAPEGPLMLETAILRDGIDEASDAARATQESTRATAAEADAAAFREALGRVLDKTRRRREPASEAAAPQGGMEEQPHD